MGKRKMLLGSLAQSNYPCHLDPYRLRPRNIGMHIGPIHQHWDDTQLPCLSGVGTCIHLGPGNPNIHKEVGNPKVFNQVVQSG